MIFNLVSSGNDNKKVSQFVNRTITEIKAKDLKDVTSISDYAFINTLLESIELPDSIKSIGVSAFENCTALSTFILNKVETIEENAFKNCSSLSSIYYKGTKEEWDSIDISGDGNEILASSLIYCYSETTPTTEGNYWRYIKGVPTDWKLITIVSFNVNDDYGTTIDSVFCINSENYILYPPERSGYTFDGWFNGDVQVTDSEGLVENWSSEDKEITLTAHWTKLAEEADTILY